VRFATGQRRSAHGVWRAARHHSGGVNNSRNSIGTLTSTLKLQYGKIIAGIQYKTSQGKIKQDYKHKKHKNNDNNSMDKETDSDNKATTDIEQKERQQAEQDSSCWFVKKLGNMTQDRPERVFQLLGGDLNSALSRDICNRKISDILWLIETWDVQCGGFS
jgi:hypothetical protein